MMYVECVLVDEKKEGHTRGTDYAVCNGRDTQFRATPRKEYKEGEVNLQTGLSERMPL